MSRNGLKLVLFLLASDVLFSTLQEGSARASQNPKHAFGAKGTYCASLAISNSRGSDSVGSSASVGNAGAIKAASPSFADVKAAVSKANPGDTVIIPEGRATWDRPLVITKGINLIGAGIGQTVIMGNYAATGNYFQSTYYLVSYVPANPELNEPFRLSGITLDMGAKCYGVFLKNKSTTAITKVRIDHLKTQNMMPAHVSIWVYGAVYGVADNCEIEYCRTFGLGARAWTSLTFDYGTADNFYLEDNTMVMSSNHVLAYGEAGSRYCFRHNKITIAPGEQYPLFDAHGNGPSYAHSATMGIEIYENTINAQGQYMGLLDLRGGKALVYNNTVTNSRSSVGIKVREEYFDSVNPPANNVISGQPQHVSDSYFWGNRYGGGASRLAAYVSHSLDYGGRIGIVPRANVHYWDENPAFDGTTGVGVGLLTDRPKTCTVGVAYWATDAKTLYKCTTSNIWTEYYRPYPYPHPLRK